MLSRTTERAYKRNGENRIAPQEADDVINQFEKRYDEDSIASKQREAQDSDEDLFPSNKDLDKE